LAPCLVIAFLLASSFHAIGYVRHVVVAVFQFLDLAVAVLDHCCEIVERQTLVLEKVFQLRKVEMPILIRRAKHPNQLADPPCYWFVQRAHDQHLSRCPHILQRQSSESLLIRGSSSPALVASITVTARSLIACANAASNGIKRCSRSHVS